MKCLTNGTGDCENCKGCASLKCRNCIFYDRFYGCDAYRDTGKCLFKYKPSDVRYYD